MKSSIVFRGKNWLQNNCMHLDPLASKLLSLAVLNLSIKRGGAKSDSNSVLTFASSKSISCGKNVLGYINVDNGQMDAGHTDPAINNLLRVIVKNESDVI